MVHRKFKNSRIRISCSLNLASRVSSSSTTSCVYEIQSVCDVELHAVCYGIRHTQIKLPYCSMLTIFGRFFRWSKVARLCQSLSLWSWWNHAELMHFTLYFKTIKYFPISHLLIDFLASFSLFHFDLCAAVWREQRCPDAMHLPLSYIITECKISLEQSRIRIVHIEPDKTVFEATIRWPCGEIRIERHRIWFDGFRDVNT